MYRWTDEKLRNIFHNRQRFQRNKSVGQWIDGLIENVVQPKQTKLMRIQYAWRDLLPEELSEHSRPDSLRGGRLRVKVDSSAHQQELHWILQEDLVKQLRSKCPGITINDIKLVRGRF